MIQTSRQLKALVRNRSGGDSAKAQVIIRNYVMERFLERIALSKYNKHFILKGGMLISALVGLDYRSTMDMDTTIRNLPLTVSDVTIILNEIIDLELEDNISFSIKRIFEIMDEAEYPGVRAMLEAKLDTMRIPLKIDISAGDMVTPREIEFAYKLMFEDRTISVYAYNIETVLAEKMETIISRGTTNTRLRDFYDLYILQQELSIEYSKLGMALEATGERRNTVPVLKRGIGVLTQIHTDKGMRHLWIRYQKKFDYAAEYSWDTVMESVISLYEKAKFKIME